MNLIGFKQARGESLGEFAFVVTFVAAVSVCVMISSSTGISDQLSVSLNLPPGLTSISEKPATALVASGPLKAPHAKRYCLPNGSCINLLPVLNLSQGQGVVPSAQSLWVLKNELKQAGADPALVDILSRMAIGESKLGQAKTPVQRDEAEKQRQQAVNDLDRFYSSQDLSLTDPLYLAVHAHSDEIKASTTHSHESPPQ